ncbi:hypothetical protein [Amphibiibacter pelophylacis]|uniref:Uncharacterized protein n=1 Tax=Amphibiibacter pelophylacis TaxID=1799477 RepID=A0ACC6P0Q9_9BURK
MTPYTSPRPQNAETALRLLEQAVQTLQRALEGGEAAAVAQASQRLQMDLKSAVSQLLPQAQQAGGLTPPQRQRLVALQQAIARQRELVARLGAHLSDAMELLLPLPNDPTYRTRIEKHLPVPQVPRPESRRPVSNAIETP